MLELMEAEWEERSGVNNPLQKYPVKAHLVHKPWWVSDRELYNGDPECDHEVTGGDTGSGIQCRRCSAWFCF
ncbi:hypothetical protein SEA_CECE_47 [Microbacterium phage Cece]|nr:hypothetical protein SEA_CECE_47 [Microbacterium phage Cece]